MMRDKLFWIEKLHRHHFPYLTNSRNKILGGTLFTLNFRYVILIEWTFYDFVICKSKSTTLCVNGAVQFTFFLVMRLKLPLSRVVSCLLQYLKINFFIVKAQKSTEKTPLNNVEVKYGFAKLFEKKLNSNFHGCTL